MSFEVVEHPSAERFLKRAAPWLLQHEAENNLILGIAHEMTLDHTAADNVLLATVESDARVVGCVFRTPPFKVGLSRLPLKAIPGLVDAIGGMWDSLPGVLGPHEEARYFARTWCGPRALSFRPVMDQRIYRLDEIIPPGTTAPGQIRVAVDSDGPLVHGWLSDFFQETRMPSSNAELVAGRLLNAGSMFVWTVDDVTVSMAGVTGWTPNGARIGFVFTPEEERGKGYGTAITAALAGRLLDEGRASCYLFADASNSTSNRIYQSLGFRPVADVVDFQFF
jgi:RimJ/RimL family protein N-acetyltransferase